VPRWPYEFHVAREVRERCRFDETLFASSGHAVLARPEAAQRFAAALRASGPAYATASAADLFALGLLDEAAHLVIAGWRREREPHALADALEALERRLGRAATQALLAAFVSRFPPESVRRGALDPDAWLAGSSAGRPHPEVAIEELLLLSLEDANPAASAYHELFDAAPLAGAAPYAAALAELERFLAARATVGESGLTLLEFLRAPVRAAPRALAGQLEYVRRHWGPWIGDLLERMQLAFDLRREEERWWAARAARPWAGDAEPPDYAGLEAERERFSADAEWMPRAVMIAKSTLVWLDQLARRHGREIRRLDQVPDEELERLAAFGINTLWLIGVWERSPASRRIKQLAGNPDAAASAYAVYDYVVAGELGGEEAWARLRERAAERGIRLASDMVPNHMGLDSRWLVEHPEWFLSRPDSPYPAYRFEGPELSDDPRVSVRIEDHYWDRSDAAVVFRRADRASGETRYVYHGNDGTGFPWNDTAQLDYLNPAAREAVIRAILGVARRSPVIRFDAAMTLAKRHIQRLWFPEPGGEGIPSRAGHGMTRAGFERAMPHEFWREVVDRVAAEAPGTLLLAEAFWLMEGYFVRTLGMHRVYNSAFMVMLRDERNADFRRVLRDTLAFDPRILQRWVNYLNNPDERTAVDQFGRGEKYFGVCTLMATLPGLPMFGHGQIEGFEERYGMEFRRARRDEPVDEGLEREHWRRIVPLLRRRALFAGAAEFLLYDCRDHSGHVNEDVVAYSNRDASGAALVLYHNRYAEARGRIRVSAAYAEVRGDGARAQRQRALLDGLGLAHLPDDALVRCRDAVRGHEHLLRAGELREHGLQVELGAFGSRVLLDWREAARDGRPWDELARTMPADGLPDLERSLWELAVRPAQARFGAAVAAYADHTSAARAALLDALEPLAREAAARLTWPAPDSGRARRRLAGRLGTWAALRAETGPAERAAHAAWLLLEACGAAFDPEPAAAGRALRLFDELRLREPLASAVRAHHAEAGEAWRLAARVRALLAHPDAPADWPAFLADEDARFAAGLDAGASRTEAPGWLELPAAIEPRAGR
jgi:glycosidase